MPPTDPDPDKTLPPSTPPADPGATVPPSHARTATYTSGGAMPDVGGTLGRYRIDRKLGEGGMGAVYLAHDTALDRPVALKVPKFAGNADVAGERFLREARAAAAFQHPNICPIYDIGEVGGTHYLAMAFVTGEPLSASTGPGHPMAPAEAARIVRQVALAMQAAHDRGIIHRDLKPANVMIDDRGEPVVMDFGLARRDAGDRQLTVQGDVMGTPAYMPPEQISGDVAKMGPASDVYALGGVLYELLTGAPPFAGDLLALIGQIIADTPKPPSSRRPGLDPRFDSVCLKALAKKPEERWKSMRAFADMLAGLAGGPAPAGRADGPTITLRVEGTNFAYRPPAILPHVTVGRQKRKPGEPADQGNDFVLRVAGNDALSARISRRHFELNRTPTGWSVTDRSKVGVTRNGNPLPKDVAVPLGDGDTLGVAGVVTLEVSIRGAGGDDGVKYAAVVAVPAPPSAGGGQLQIEASVGDMVTMD